MQTIAVFVIYFLLFTWLIGRIAFIKNAGLQKGWIWGLFSIKILAGLAYGLFYLQPAYNATSDTWHFFELSKGETDWLLNDPRAFFKDIFVYGYGHSGNLFLGENSYWNDLKSNIIIKLLAICNVFTFKNYYADIIFFNFFFFFGPIALYRLVRSTFDTNKILTVAIVFLIPSFLFWCSGIHKDGLIFSCTALIIFHVQKQLNERKFISSSIIWMSALFILLFALRNFMALLLVPSLLIWILAFFYPKKSVLITAIAVFSGVLLFFLSGTISNETSLPQYIIEKQNEFKQLSGTSQIYVPLLENTVSSFARFLPTAIDIAFFRPHITEINNLSYIPAAAEIIVLWAAIIVSFFIKKTSPYSKQQSSFLLFCVVFSVLFLLLAGYTITFSGAIVRYRATVLPFLFIPVLNRLSALIKYKKK